MTQRTYKIVETPPGHKGTTIEEFQDGHSHAALWLPDGTGSVAIIDSTQALARAHQHGREDRSGEILGEAGLGRATSAAYMHQLFSDTTCRCGWTGSSVADFYGHVAYEVLQAAARLP